MTITSRLRIEASGIWERIFEHPFVTGLYSGTLPLSKFRYYIVQDYNYLVTVCRCFALIASKAEYTMARRALELAYIEATTEMANYERIVKRLGMSLDEVIKAEPAPTNTAYANFLLATCALGSPLEGLIALLPCFWSYLEIAERHRDRLADNRNELYVEWAKVYLTDDYRNLVRSLRELVDREEPYLDYRMARSLFITASRYEYLFWDMAYKEEGWPV